MKLTTSEAGVAETILCSMSVWRRGFMADATGGSALNLIDLFPDWSYLFSAPFTSSQGITAFFILVLAMVFFLAIGAFFYHQTRAKRKISFLSEKLIGVESNELIQKREQIKQDMAEDQNCGSLWNEFDESLVSSNDSENKTLYNTVDAAHFFDTHTLARGMTESRLIAAMPGILTAIGVLGTFAGLTLGLGGLGQIGGGETQHLKDGISGMIHAASIAFTTSFWGVFLSVIFNVFEKWGESGIRKDIYNLQNRIDYLFPRLTPEKMLMDISSYSRSSDETMLGLAEKIGDRMQETVIQMKDEISLGMANALQEVLAPAIGKLVDSANDMNNRQVQSSEGALESILESFTEKFGQAGAQQGKMMLDSAESLKDLLNQMKVEQKLSIEQSAATNEKNGDAFTKVIDEVHKQFELVGEEFRGKLESLSDEQKQVMDNTADDIQSFFGSVKQDREIANQNSIDVEEKREQIFVAFIKQMSEQFNQFKLTGEQNHQAAESVIVQQKNVTDSVRSVVGDLLTFAEVLEDVSGQLGTAAKEIKDGNQELAKTSQVMAGAVSDAARSNERVSQSNVETNHQLQGLLRLVEESRSSAEMISTQLRSAAEAGKTTFDELKHHQAGYRDALNNHVQELEEQLSGVLEKYATKVTDQTHHRMQAWDKETNNYTSSMQGIVSVMQELVDEIDSKKNQ